MIGLLSGQILYTLTISVLDAALLSWLALSWYRRSVLRLMTQRTASDAGGPDAPTIREESSAAPVTSATASGELTFALFESVRTGDAGRLALPDARPAFARLVLAYALGALAWSVVVTTAQFTGLEPPVLAVAWLMGGWTNMWLLVPSLALLLAWHPRRTAKAAAVYVTFGLFLVALFTFARQLFTGSFTTAPLTNALLVVPYLAAAAWLPALILLPAALRRVRAVMPLALAAVLVFGVTSLVFRGALLVAFDHPAVRSVVLEAAALTSVSVTYYGVFLVVALPVGWFCWKLIRMLASGFERKRFSDPQIIVDCWWIVLTAVQTSELALRYGVLALPVGIAAFIAYRGAVAIVLRMRPHPSAASGERVTLLRVFGYQARTEALFDQVAQRWRFRGPVQLIAGTDLALRTTDPGDLLTFVQGQLSARYVRSAAEVSGFISRLDDRRDPDGRFRVNEVYCHDDTWRGALIALLDRSDALLADLRGFSERNAGCRFELAQLLRRVRAERVTIVHDRTTDLVLLARVLADAYKALVDEGRLAGTAPVSLVRVDRQTPAAISTILACMRGERAADRVITAAALAAPANARVVAVAATAGP